MFAHIIALFTLATLAAAAPSGLAARTEATCCASIVSSTSHVCSEVAALVGLDLSGLGDIPVGLSCSPITVIGNNCGGTTVTCSGPSSAGGLISVNCIPITL
ncbi:Hydrophobin 2 [Mycena indigotica]|uniref:Hydrophobin n=1 Tax=Mycena indigotica TaxID=2126181 RepID=A0A8H6VUP1_9AGAR|nr:Hydrophobin 2 [Mycena indigotica]KAF7288894.1 Hydrophobin 2 [Mycena indigotica]